MFLVFWCTVERGSRAQVGWKNRRESVHVSLSPGIKEGNHQIQRYPYPMETHLVGGSIGPGTLRPFSPTCEHLKREHSAP